MTCFINSHLYAMSVYTGVSYLEIKTQVDSNDKPSSRYVCCFWWCIIRTKVYSAFHPSGVGKWVPAAAGKAKAGMAHSKKCEIPSEHMP